MSSIDSTSHGMGLDDTAHEKEVCLQLLDHRDVPDGYYLVFFDSGHGSYLVHMSSYDGKWPSDFPLHGKCLGVIPQPVAEEGQAVFRGVLLSSENHEQKC